SRYGGSAKIRSTDSAGIESSTATQSPRTSLSSRPRCITSACASSDSNGSVSTCDRADRPIYCLSGRRDRGATFLRGLVRLVRLDARAQEPDAGDQDDAADHEIEPVEPVLERLAVVAEDRADVRQAEAP